MKRFNLTVLTLAMLLSACHLDGSGKYVGKWANVNKAVETIEIDRNGDGFMLRITAQNPLFGRLETHSFPASLKDGALQVQGVNGGMAVVIDSKTGNLVLGRDAYRKAE